MTNKIKMIVGLAVVAIVLMLTMATLFLPANFPRYSNGSESGFRIVKGESLNKITQSLADNGIVRIPILFKVYAVVSGQSKNLKAGLYKLSPDMSIGDLVRIFSSGLYENEDTMVLVPEGSNINDVDLIFAKSGLTKKGDFLTSALVAKEGYLFPDTYQFTPGTPKDAVILKLENNFLGKIKFTVSARTIVIASILEKEVKTKEDMSLVAGIIEKRISLGMPLQIDATTAYGECYGSFIAGMNCETSQVNLTQAIKRDSPYNTYKIKGLPVGPISNPGLNAIQAALHPTTSDYLYYLTDKDGNVHYARTSAEHLQNRIKYLH